VVRQVELALQAIFTDGVSRDELKARGVAGRRIVGHRTMQDYVADCCRFARWCKLAYGIRYVREITPEMAGEYVQGLIDLDRAGGYVGRVKAAIRKLDVAMRERGWRRRRAPELLEAGGGWHSDRRPERAYTPDQAARIVAFMRRHAGDEQAADVARLQRVAGLRVSEAAMIRGQDVDPRACTVHAVRATKGGRPRTVTVAGEHRPFLERLAAQAEGNRDGHVFQGRGERGSSLARRVEGAVRYACGQLEIACYGTHGFRKCWAQELHRQLGGQGFDDRAARREVAEGLGVFDNIKQGHLKQ
jgi:integrase